MPPDIPQQKIVGKRPNRENITLTNQETWRLQNHKQRNAKYHQRISPVIKPKLSLACSPGYCLIGCRITPLNFPSKAPLIQQHLQLHFSSRKHFQIALLELDLPFVLFIRWNGEWEGWKGRLLRRSFSRSFELRPKIWLVEIRLFPSFPSSFCRWLSK